ncbi:MAG TPA: hypothetical protein DF614_08430 [Methylococcaceae bacterium]|nr:hypothetical protein [Methylococcaceae bacterium]
MNFDTYFNIFNLTIDEEHCASLTPAFCPEIIALLNSQRGVKRSVSHFSNNAANDYGFDEHVQGLA